MFGGVTIGNKGTMVNLPYFADETLFVCEAKVKNIIIIKSMLKCFELMSSLKFNFHKSRIGGGTGLRWMYWKTYPQY